MSRISELTCVCYGQVDFFKKSDVDASGDITKKEFGKAVRILGFETVAKEDIDGVFDELDKDGSGKITYAELDQALRRLPKNPRKR